MPSRIGRMERIRLKNGSTVYQITVWHDDLAKHRVVKANSGSVAEQLARAQLSEWDRQWFDRQIKARDTQERAANRIRTQQSVAAQKQSREEAKRYLEEQKQFAQTRTIDAQNAIQELREILSTTLKVNDAINWKRVKDTAPFPEPKPTPPIMPPPPVFIKPSHLNQKPDPQSEAYKPQVGFLDLFSGAKRKQKEDEAHARFKSDLETWQSAINKEQAKHDIVLQKHRSEQETQQIQHAETLKQWESDKASYITNQREGNAAIDTLRQRYESQDSESILPYCDLVLSQSSYPEWMPDEWELDYTAETKTLVVDLLLPAPEALPTLSEVKYNPMKDEFTEKHITPALRDKFYDELLYQIVLRTVHELFEADTALGLDAITFNGLVRSVDRSTGKETTNCVLSLQSGRGQFMDINLAAVDPKACFRQLKGVGSSKLHSITPVAPIMQIRREDGRFVSSYDVAHQLDEGYNLASMHWEDFEHLIREVFEKEFSSAGGEVRVTQASRDGGVDAVVFDPDPIRGGKIVIQAKRYTGTVGVSAVRDLYGTVMNEGATKGILVSTSDYGPDSYEFAKGKPLSLLNGANLLFLLEKHGHKARIDLQEARKIALEQKAS